MHCIEEDTAGVFGHTLTKVILRISRTLEDLGVERDSSDDWLIGSNGRISVCRRI
jgi:hypothetical protein